MGALLALRLIPTISHVGYANALGGIGLSAILGGVFFYDATTPFPGPAALAPCIGAVLVIYSGTHQRTWVSRLLSLPPLVWIGLISYSLYLWHWPILVSLRHVTPEPPTDIQIASAIGLTFLLAGISWRFVETPFRRRTRILNRPRVLGAAVTAIVLAGLAGIVIVHQKGVYFRVPPIALELALTARDRPRFDACQRLTGDDVRAGKLCTIGPRDQPPSVLIWGDSHAYALMPLLADMATECGVSGIYAPQGACAPLLGVKRLDPVGSPECLDFNLAIPDILRATPSIKTTLLIARWAENFEPQRFKSWAPPLVLHDTLQPGSNDDNRAVFKRAITRTLATLAAMGQSVAIVTQVPDLPFNAPRYLATRAMFGDELIQSVDQTSYLARQRGVSSLFENLQPRYRLSFIHPEHWLCQNGRCALFRNNVLLYRDDTHLSVRGSEVVRPAFEPFFSKQAGSPMTVSSSRAASSQTTIQ